MLAFDVGLEGWTFTADLRPAGIESVCARSLPAVVEATDDGYLLSPVSDDENLVSSASGRCPPDALFQRGDSLGEQAALLGDPPFTYTVAVTVDGTVHTGTGEWPTDTDDEITPSVPMTFTPPLPTWSPPTS